MPTNQILQYLKVHGERLDTEIAEATGISLTTAQIFLSELTANGLIMSCHLIRFENDKKIEGLTCRLAGYIPQPAPGRKTK